MTEKAPRVEKSPGQPTVAVRSILDREIVAIDPA